MGNIASRTRYIIKIQSQKRVIKQECFQLSFEHSQSEGAEVTLGRIGVALHCGYVTF